MNDSVIYWVTASYRANEPRIAQDETPAAALLASIRKLRRQWLKRFDGASIQLATYFSTAIADRSDAVLKKILKDGGFAVEFRMSATQRDVLQATIGEQVGLIKSIAADYLGKVEGLVMRSVQAGGDLGQLTQDLQAQFGVTKRRAAFIARDQCSKATANLTRTRALELGLDESQWQHSAGGRHPRPTHVKAGRDKQRYKTREGWLDPALNRRIWPGTEPNCKCVSRIVLPTKL